MRGCQYRRCLTIVLECTLLLVLASCSPRPGAAARDTQAQKANVTSVHSESGEMPCHAYWVCGVGGMHHADGDEHPVALLSSVFVLETCVSTAAAAAFQEALAGEAFIGTSDPQCVRASNQQEACEEINTLGESFVSEGLALGIVHPQGTLGGPRHTRKGISQKEWGCR